MTSGSQKQKNKGVFKLKKKLFVVSDIHGHCTLLKEALKNAGFDSENEAHLLICLGDYFDRGDENKEVLKFFERLKHKVLLMGNHEELLLKLLETGKLLPHNYINGTVKTLENFFGKYFVDPVDDTIAEESRTHDGLKCHFCPSLCCLHDEILPVCHRASALI